MSVQIKLDAAAVASLFPEGSEARLELQQAVINETVRKIVDRELAKTRQLVEAQCRRVAEEALASAGITSKLWNGVKLSDETEKRLKAQALEAANNAMSVALARAMEPLVSDLDARIKKYAEGEMQFRLNAMAKEALRHALK